MRKYKRYINRKTLIALSAAFALGFNVPAYAEDAMLVETGTEDNPVEAENPKGTTIDTPGEFGSFGNANYRYFYGMITLDSSATSDGGLSYTGNAGNFGGRYVTLTNNGIIRLSYKDIYDAYADQLITTDDSSRTYAGIMGRGIMVGNYSHAINNGQIYMTFDEADSTSNLFFHGIYVHSGADVDNTSTATNNGLINITGNGSAGAQVRALTTQANYVTLANNGDIYINVDRSQVSRAVATTGLYGTLINNGTIYNKSNGTNFGMSRNEGTSLTNNGVIKVILDTTYDHGAAASSWNSLDSIAVGVGAQGGGLVYNGTLTEEAPVVNNGVIDVSVVGDNPDATATAVGFLLGNRSGVANYRDTGYWLVENNGLINYSSTVTPSADNNYIVRAAEIGINSIAASGTPANYVKAKFGNWATTLRDFSTTNDFILVTPVSNIDPNNEYPVSLDFSESKFILRPDSGYTAGTAYEISEDTLVTSVDNNTAEYTVTGMDTMQFTTEMSDFVTANVSEISTGDYNVSLSPVNSDKTENLIASAAMLPIDFTRNNLDRISYELEREDNLNQKWFISPYISRFDRDNGMDGKAHGYIGGSEWQLGNKTFGGLHVAYALGSGDGGAYSSDGNMKSLLAGLHFTTYPNEDKNWISGQATFIHNTGDTSYTMNTDTSTLNGKSSNKSDGFYLAANYGFKNDFSDQDALRTEIGLSYLNMSDSPEINWNLLGSNIDGYKMTFDDYNALYATAKTRWTHNFSDEDNGGKLNLTVGLRGRLAGEKVKMHMMNTAFNSSVKEDPVQALVNLEYAYRMKKFELGLGYQGTFGKDTKNNNFYAQIKSFF
ncbi:MAG: autotransporter outer membrane beta-barrel domain-containing protein [Selenomonadaceae bacterium]|nr:autotransporter outer membrane beta-barrel domain-containing protein [Selenomonadaceae bacterium]